MWRGEMWRGLLAWWQSDPTIQQATVVRAAARRVMCAMLSPERLPVLALRQFHQDICRSGAVTRADGRFVDLHSLLDLPRARLQAMLDSGELVTIGNQCLDVSSRVAPQVLPGLEEVRVEDLRDFLGELLHGPGDPEELVQAAAAGDAAVSAACASMILCMCGPQPRGIWTPDRLAGLRRLAMLTGFDEGLAGVHESYASYNEVLCRLRLASEGVLGDALDLDLLLGVLSAQRDPRPWKIAVGLSVPQAEAEVVARHCLAEGFAVIAPADADDPNVARLQAMVPGDCVLMHLRGRIGAIGRVTRPYYEVDPESGDPVARQWWRRIGVHWLAGDRDYGSHLSGARQRFSVIELDWATWWAIAGTYRQLPEYDGLFRPLRGAWVLRCDARRRETLARLERPLPLRDQWTLQISDELPEPGDLVFLWCDGDGPGICARARVISEPRRRPREDRGSAQIDLLYEDILPAPLGPHLLGRDARLASWAMPAGEAAARLSPEQTMALAEMLAMPSERQFLLIADGRQGAGPHPQTVYRFGHGSAGEPAALTAAVSAGTVHCLVYHGSPEHSFVGFGTVTGLTAHGGAPHAAESMELGLELCRFPRRTGDPTLGGRAAPAPAPTRALGRRAGRTRTVLPVSACDFYRVVGAGMGALRAADNAPGLEEVAEQCGAPIAVIDEIERLLRERGQMIFYGPPGTGKTWVALRVAHYLTGGDEGRCEIVQFHPSYSYEDFIEGIRPQVVETREGHSDVTYPVVPGAFVSFCARARADPESTFVFVIDEINRAHVPNVFGELMLALEYRDREVELAHSAVAGNGSGADGRFSVPRNVLVLATMNTADRSTALVDYALRRRFVFYPFFPDDRRFVGAMLRAWLDGNAPHMAWVAELLALVNELVEPEVGRHLLIGHSYFMRPSLTEDTVRDVWRFQLMPLLEEYFAGTPERLDELDLDDLIARAKARAAEATAGGAGGAEP